MRFTDIGTALFILPVMIVPVACAAGRTVHAAGKELRAQQTSLRSQFSDEGRFNLAPKRLAVPEGG